MIRSNIVYYEWKNFADKVIRDLEKDGRKVIFLR